MRSSKTPYRSFDLCGDEPTSLGNIGKACEVVLRESLSEKECRQSLRPREVTNDTVDGFLLYMVQVVMAVKRCLLDRMSVLLGRCSPQLPILSRLIDEQLRILQTRCKGYASTRVCFQVWCAARVSRLANKQSTQLENSLQKMTRMQVEKRALILRVLELAQERDSEACIRLQHRCLVKWHQFVIAKQMASAMESQLVIARQHRDQHAIRSIGMICQLLDTMRGSMGRAILHLWFFVIIAERESNVSDFWRADAATLHADCNNLRTLQVDMLARTARIQQSLRCSKLFLRYFLRWRYHSRVTRGMLVGFAQHATRLFTVRDMLLWLFCVIKVWCLHTYMTKGDRNQIVTNQLQDSYLHCLHILRASALRSSLRRQASRLTFSMFVFWKDLVGEKRNLSERRCLCLKHDAIYQQLLFLWETGSTLDMQKFCLCCWAVVVKADARFRLLSTQLSEIESSMKATSVSRCCKVLCALEDELILSVKHIIMVTWILVLNLSRQRLREQRHAVECNSLIMAGESNRAIYLKQVCMRAWMFYINCECRETEQKRLNSEAKDREFAASLEAVMESNDTLLERVHQLASKERLVTLLQMSLIGWAEVLNARALASEKQKAHDSRRSLAFAFEAIVSRIFMAWDSSHASHLKRRCFGSWLSLARASRCEFETESLFRAAKDCLGLTKDMWCDCALQACDIRCSASLRSVCFRGWMSAILQDRRHEAITAKLAKMECVQRHASVVMDERRSQLLAAWMQEHTMFLKLSCLQCWRAALVMDRKRKRDCAVETQIYHESFRMQHSAQLAHISFALQCSDADALLRHCLNGWIGLLLRDSKSRLKKQHRAEVCAAQSAACDRMILILAWEQSKHLMSTCLSIWLEAMQAKKIYTATKLQEDCNQTCRKVMLNLESTVSAWEKAKLRFLKHVVVAGWLDVMSAAAFAKSEVFAFGCQQSTSYKQMLKAWDNTFANFLKRLIVQLWHGATTAAKRLAHEAAKATTATDLQHHASQALAATRCCLEKAWAEQFAASSKQACFQAWIAMLSRRGKELEAERLEHEERLKRQHMCAIGKHCLQYERVVTAWESEKCLGMKHACLIRWISMLHAKARMRLEEGRLVETQQCATPMHHSARCDWALHAWERGLCVSLKHVCFRGWASVVHAERRESEDMHSVARCNLPEQSTQELRKLLGRGRRGASIIRQLHGILATAAEDSDQVAQHRATSLAAGEVALISAALPSHSPAWSEARRARLELEQLERLTRHLRKGVIPALSYLEAAHSELLAALEIFASGWGCSSTDSFQSEYSVWNESIRHLGNHNTSINAAQDEGMAVLSTALSLSGSISAVEPSTCGKLQANSPLLTSDRMSMSSGTPTLGTPRLGTSLVITAVDHCPPAVSLPVPFALSPSPSRQQLNQSRTAALEGVVCNLRSFVEERRQVSRLRGSPPRQSHGSGHIGATRQRQLC